jgi:hypothetical protein
LSQVKADFCSSAPYEVDCVTCLEGVAQSMEDALRTDVFTISGKSAPTIPLPASSNTWLPGAPTTAPVSGCFLWMDTTTDEICVMSSDGVVRKLAITAEGGGP